MDSAHSCLRAFLFSLSNTLFMVLILVSLWITRVGLFFVELDASSKFAST